MTGDDGDNQPLKRALGDRAARFREFERWEADYRSPLTASEALAAAAALYELLPRASRSRPVDVSGVMRLHRILSRAAAG